jgi:hypothetical protein
MAIKRTRKKCLSWDEIGKMIGKKVEHEFKKEEISPWRKHWVVYKEQAGGGLGRLIFAIGVLYSMCYAGWLTGIPTWAIVLMAIGFTFMRL